jgi:hypothetical protein
VTTPSMSYPFGENYDFSFRPDTYWPNAPTTGSFLSQIRGTARRDIARRALEGEELVRLDGPELYAQGMEFVLQDQLGEDERERWGSLHPAMMGGEYLPQMSGDEVEIARVELASTTGDVIEVRAQREDGRIHYRVVDEYETTWTISPASSEQPLALGELIELIDTAADDRGPDGSAYNIGLTDCFRDYNWDGLRDPEELLGFVWVTSPFYPQLESYYGDRAAAWVEEKQRDDGGKGAETLEQQRLGFEEQKDGLDEMIWRSGRSYREEYHVFNSYEERSVFEKKLLADSGWRPDWEKPTDELGQYSLPDGRLLLVRNLHVVVYEPVADEEEQREPRPAWKPGGIFDKKKAEVDELIRRSGRRYREEHHSFATYIEREAFLFKKLGEDLPTPYSDEIRLVDEEVVGPGICHFPDGVMVLTHYLNVVVYEPAPNE